MAEEGLQVTGGNKHCNDSFQLKITRLQQPRLKKMLFKLTQLTEFIAETSRHCMDASTSAKVS